MNPCTYHALRIPPDVKPKLVECPECGGSGEWYAPMLYGGTSLEECGCCYGRGTVRQKHFPRFLHVRPSCVAGVHTESCFVAPYGDGI